MPIFTHKSSYMSTKGIFLPMMFFGFWILDFGFWILVFPLYSRPFNNYDGWRAVAILHRIHSFPDLHSESLRGNSCYGRTRKPFYIKSCNDIHVIVSDSTASSKKAASSTKPSRARSASSNTLVSNKTFITNTFALTAHSTFLLPLHL